MGQQKQKNKVKGKQQAITTKKVAQQQQQPNDITRIFESVLED